MTGVERGDLGGQTTLTQEARVPGTTRAPRRRPPTAHTYLDSVDGQAIGIVRYDGAPETWERLARRVLDEAGIDQEEYANLAEPVLGWWRMNVCAPDHWLGWAWSIAKVDGPGPGRWQGAEVRFKASNDQGAGDTNR
jgi:hypothetical protein